VTTTGVHVRLALPDDLPAVVAISNWAAQHTAANFAIEPETEDMWQQEWRETHEAFPWLMAVDDAGKILGFAKASPWKGRCAYEWTAETTVYIAPDHHGRGVGTALYGTLIGILRDQGYRTVLGGITQPNPASVRLHEAMGYRRVALLERVGWKFDRWHDVGYWELHLQEGDGAPAAIRPVSEVWVARSTER